MEFSAGMVGGLAWKYLEFFFGKGEDLQSTHITHSLKGTQPAVNEAGQIS